MASKLFREESFEVLSCIAFKHFGEHIISAELLHGGLFNTSYKLLFHNKSPVVLRLGPIHTELLLPFEMHLIRAEEEACAMLAQAGIPGNFILAVDESQSIVKRGYMLFTYLHAQPLSSVDKSNSHFSGLMAHAGLNASQIHTVEGQWFGRLSNGYRGIRHSTWFDFLLADATENAVCCQKRGILTETQVDAVRQAFVQNAACFEHIHTPKLIHGDLWSGNVLVDVEAERVLAIIDADRSLWGDPDFDLANPWMINADFLKGYGRQLSDEPLQVKKRLLYRLIYALADAYVWLVEYDDAAASCKQVATMEEIVKKVLP